MFFGRPYWNLGAVKQCLAKLPGFVEREFDRDLSVQGNYEGDGLRTPVTLLGIIRAVPTILAIPAIWKRQDRFDRAFLAGGFEVLMRKYERSTLTRRRVSRPDPRGLLDHRVELLPHLSTARLAKLAFMDSFPDADYPALVSALPAMKHLDPTRALREMAARGETDVAPLLKHFAHRSRRELDLRAPRWDEDGEWVRTLLEQHSGAAGTDPRPAYEAARAAALSRLPWHKRRTFGGKLDRLRHFLWLREEMRDISSRMYHLIRRYVLAIAEQRRLGDDVFFMSFQAIIADKRANIPPPA